MKFADKHSIMNEFIDNSTSEHESDQIQVMHFVANNVDHNVRTLDDSGTFHGKGFIYVTVAQRGDFGNTHELGWSSQ
jgi:hypothetical protein